MLKLTKSQYKDLCSECVSQAARHRRAGMRDFRFRADTTDQTSINSGTRILYPSSVLLVRNNGV